MHILQAASSTYAGILVTIILTLRLAEAGYDQTLYPFGKDGTASAGGGIESVLGVPHYCFGGWRGYVDDLIRAWKICASCLGICAEPHADQIMP